MRKLIVAAFLTLDGVMEATEEWQPTYVSEDVAEVIQARYHAGGGAAGKNHLRHDGCLLAVSDQQRVWDR